jgi:hypothetical protein
MVDYDRPTGTAGTLRIRDTGTAVEFWILCADGATNTGSLAWAVSLPSVGHQHSGNVSLAAGFGSRMLYSYPLAASGTVYFSIGASGTSGLGGPTDHSAYISRVPVGGVPPAPAMLPGTPDQITATSMRVQFSSSGDGGSPVTGWDLQRAEDAAFTVGVYWQLSSGTTVDTGLRPGTTYHYRARGVNAYGPGGWSAAVSGRTLGAVYVSDGTTWKPSAVLVDDGTTARAAEVYVSDGTTWRAAG